MKKNVFVFALAVALLLTLAGCGCDHEWYTATCTSPKTCSLCGKTEGEPLPHTWLDATCTAAKTCTVCGKTEGDALGHSWLDATCTAPKTCSACQATEGEAAGHQWEEATTEAPKTCSVCKQTSGSKLETDPRFTTASTKDLQGTWICDITATDEMMGLENFGGMECRITMTFGNTGELTIRMDLKDEKAFMEQFKDYTMNELYESFTAQGMSKEQADQAMRELYGMTVSEYVDVMLKSINMQELFAAFNAEEVYYVEGNQIFTAESWNAAFESNTFTITDGNLVIDGMSLEEGGQAAVWKRA